LSKWAGKTVIGLTGNIGTGKSVVRRMLEHLGAFGIDADALSHRVISKGAPGYNEVIKQFGLWILAPNGEIDRKKLGQIVFSDPAAMKTLEGIVHPLVNQVLDYIIQRITKKVVVIEAIKLLESDIKGMCNSIWVAYAPEEIQLERLVNRRKMNQKDALQRIRSQSPQVVKMGEANVVIKNDGSVEDTWKQVVRHWKKYAPSVSLEPKEPAATVQTLSGELHIVRGSPGNSSEIADLFNRLTKNQHTYTRTDIMEAFGEKAFLVLKAGEKSVGVIGWQVENLVSRTTDLLLEAALPFDKAVPLMIEEMERASRELQCEASLVFLEPSQIRNEKLWANLGYQRKTPQTLGVMAWQEAAADSQPSGTILLFKKLRMDRILRPI
jgi:dephospho-CoA kinase